jgi:hypothetical protein
MINSQHRRTGSLVIRLQMQFGIFVQFEQMPRTCLKFCAEVLPTAFIAPFEVFEIIFSFRFDNSPANQNLFRLVISQLLFQASISSLCSDLLNKFARLRKLSFQFLISRIITPPPSIYPPQIQRKQHQKIGASGMVLAY